MALQPSEEFIPPSTGISQTIEIHCDLIELNEFRNENDAMLLEQFIFYQWDEESGRHRKIGWVVERKCSYGRRIATDDYVVMFQYNKGNPKIIRNVRVIGKNFAKIVTPFDLEIMERNFEIGLSIRDFVEGK